MEKRNPLKIYETENQSVVNLSDGRIPPQAIDLEEAVLGAMLIDEKGVNEIIELLSPEVFYKKSHQLIYESIDRLCRESEPIDLLTVSADLKKNKNFESSGGDFYLISLSQKVSSSAHIEFHSRIILQKYIQRKLITISSEIIQKSYSETTDVMDLLDEAESKLYDVAQGNIKTSTESAQNLVIRAKNRIEEIAKQDGLSGVSTGFEKLDILTSGWQPSDLVIIAARPGMGKTAFALNIAHHVSVTAKKKVGFFSLEMSREELVDRLLVSQADIDAWRLKTGRLDQQDFLKISDAMGVLADAQIHIDDSPGLSIFEMRTRARRLMIEHQVDMIVVDYLQLAHGRTKDNRVQEVAEISQGLKNIARELKVPVLALAQLSRAIESRGEKVPQLSDLRESGSIEQDADVVMFLYRKDDEIRESVNLKIAKHRNGALGDIDLYFKGDRIKFYGMEKRQA